MSPRNKARGGEGVPPRLARQPMGRKRVLPTEGEDEEAKARSIRPTTAPSGRHPALREAPQGEGERRLSYSAAAPRIPLQGWGPNVADGRGGVSGSFPCLNPSLIPVVIQFGSLQGWGCPAER